jgi:hypothetical protein
MSMRARALADLVVADANSEDAEKPIRVLMPFLRASA